MREFVKDRTGFDGRIGTNWLAQLSKSLGLSVEPWVRALQGTQVRCAGAVLVRFTPPLNQPAPPTLSPL